MLCKVKGTATDHSLSSAGLLNYNGSWFLYLSKMDQSRIMTYQSIPETKILWPASCFNLPLSMFVFACLLDSRHLFPAHHNLCQSLGSKLIPSSPFLIPLLNTSCSAYIFLNCLGSYICFPKPVPSPLFLISADGPPPAQEAGPTWALSRQLLPLLPPDPSKPAFLLSGHIHFLLYASDPGHLSGKFIPLALQPVSQFPV